MKFIVNLNALGTQNTNALFKVCHLSLSGFRFFFFAFAHELSDSFRKRIALA